MERNQNIGKAIRALRTQKGLTQEDLAKELNISIHSFRQYEYSTREPNSKAMAALETYFGVSGAVLRGEEPLTVAPKASPKTVQPLTYRIVIDSASSAETDQSAIAIVCSKCGSIICSVAFSSGAEISMDIPQQCPYCTEKRKTVQKEKRKTCHGIIEKCPTNTRDIVDEMLTQPEKYTYEDIQSYLATEGIDISAASICRYNKGL